MANPAPRRSLREALAVLGPGLAVAATGVGAGDIVSASLSGARFGLAVVWAALAGALLKFALNEGVARWQLETGTTLLEGWGKHLHQTVLQGFTLYLLLWTFMVAGAQMAACGLAAYSLLPWLSVPAWGAIHSIVALVLIYIGRYSLFERLIKFFIALMFATVIVCAILARPAPGELLRGILAPSVPSGSGPFLLGVIGGVGGSVTLLSYSYWIREHGWEGPAHYRDARLDLGAAYLLTGLFGAAMVVIAAEVRAEALEGNEMVLGLADRIGELAGPSGRFIFLVGFWGAVFTSMLGVWQGVPYLFSDLMRIRRGDPPTPEASIDTTSRAYRGYLIFIAIPPMLLLLAGRPVWVVLIYTISGAFFMPFLAATLLFLNNRRVWLPNLRNGWVTNGLLAAALLLFCYLCYSEIMNQLS